jgi:hypothetical protein
MLTLLVSTLSWGQEATVRGGVVETHDSRATSWSSVSVVRDAADPEVFSVAFAETVRGDASLQVLEFGPHGVVDLTSVPSVQKDIYWEGVAICALTGLILLYPNTAESPPPGTLQLEAKKLDLEPVQLDRLLRALDSFGVDDDVPLYDVYDVLARR